VERQAGVDCATGGRGTAQSPRRDAAALAIRNLDNANPTGWEAISNGDAKDGLPRQIKVEGGCYEGPVAHLPSARAGPAATIAIMVKAPSRPSKLGDPDEVVQRETLEKLSNAEAGEN
jgi:hypothetical protein